MKKKLSLLSLLFVCAIGSAGGVLSDAYLAPETVFAKELQCEDEVCDSSYGEEYVCAYRKGVNCKLENEGQGCTGTICK